MTLCSNGCGRAPEIELSKNAVGFTCAYCVQAQAAPPPPPPASSALSYDERQAKKKLKEEKKAAKLEAAKTAVRGRMRGWHKKALFQHDDVFYSFGKEISATEAAKIKKELAEEQDASVEKKLRKTVKPKKGNSATNGKGRGWHLKKTFSHEGKFYSFGKEIAEKEFKKLSK